MSNGDRLIGASELTPCASTSRPTAETSPRGLAVWLVFSGLAADRASAAIGTAIAAGEDHTCAVTTAGEALCWGQNLNGQLGNGTAGQHNLPVPVSGPPSDFAAVAGGSNHTCALTSIGAAYCWGANHFWQLGDGTSTQRIVPAPVSGLSSGATAIATGLDHTCALTAGGGLHCWGESGLGQLGNGMPGIVTTVPVPVTGLSSGVGAIAAGQFHTCAALTNGEAHCWGVNDAAQLGDGTTTIRSVPIAVSGLSSDVTAVAAGSKHSCALTTAGGVECWGSGTLGNGGLAVESAPVAVSGLSSGVTAIAAGSIHTCALTAAGGVWCWGNNSEGQLGDGTTANRDVPVAVSGLSSGVTSIAAGNRHTCAVTSAGGALCWGDNGSGQLGDGTTVNKLVPIPVNGLPNALAIAAAWQHTCAVTASAGLHCWGDNQWSQLGNEFVAFSSVPGPVIGFPGPAIPALGRSGLVVLAILMAGAAHRRLAA